MNRIAIVGGGIVGASVAHRLRDAPAEVVVYERDEPGQGTTAASAGVFSWGDGSALLPDHPLRNRAWSFYRELVADGTLDAPRIGALAATDDPDDRPAFERMATRLRNRGIDADLLGWAVEDEVRASGIDAHGLRPDSVAVAVYSPTEVRLDPPAVVDHLLGESTRNGVELRRETVTDVHTDGSRVSGIDADGGRVPVDAVVNAAGPWAPAVDRLAGIELPLRHTRGPMVEIADDHDRRPFTEFETGEYVVGGRGTVVGRYDTTYGTAERLDPDAERTVDDRFLDRVETVVRERTDIARVRIRDSWVGLRTVTPDKRPVVGETGVEGYHVASGMSGLGVTLAPAVGGLVARSVLGKASVPAGLSPRRFEG